MKKLKSPPDYSLQQIKRKSLKRKNNSESGIVYAAKHLVDPTNPSCIKGDCCKDCPGNWTGG